MSTVIFLCVCLAYMLIQSSHVAIVVKSLWHPLNWKRFSVLPCLAYPWHFLRGQVSCFVEFFSVRVWLISGHAFLARLRWHVLLSASHLEAHGVNLPQCSDIDIDQLNKVVSTSSLPERWRHILWELLGHHVILTRYI